MSRGVYWLVLVCCAGAARGLSCFNCSSTQASWGQCAGPFAPPFLHFNNSQYAMCFVRSWRARSKLAWIVQRGCYHSSKDDPLPQALTKPTRAMACSRQRLAEAEYEVCLCKADWCNCAMSRFVCAARLITNTLALLAVYNLSTRTS